MLSNIPVSPRVNLTPPQNATEAAQAFCLEHQRLDAACAPLLASHLAAAVDAAARARARLSTSGGGGGSSGSSSGGDQAQTTAEQTVWLAP